MLGRVGHRVAGGADLGGHGVEGGEVESGQAHRGPDEVDHLAIYFWHKAFLAELVSMFKEEAQ